MLTGLKQISIVLTFLRGHNAVTTGLVACAGFFIVHLSYMGAPPPKPGPAAQSG